MRLFERRSYLREIQKRYKKANRKLKKQILDEFCLVCGYNRKYAIRRLAKPLTKHTKRRGPKCRYEATVLLPTLRTLWLAAEQVCSKKLKSLLPVWLPFYEEKYGNLTPPIREQILSASAATLDRLLKPVRLHHPRGKLCGTKPGTLLKHHIPIKVDNWDVTKPGFVEADTVAHCGNSMAGNFAWSITLTDIVTTWTMNAAIWNKGAAGVVSEIENIEKRAPFPFLGFDSDNGSEFLNHHLWRYFAKRKQPVQFTRSRPYHKNDNAHVEQKNWTHVRELLGYIRIDNPATVPVMNELYVLWELYQNYFIPSTKLVSKEKINSKYRKKYDAPKTPFARVLENEAISNKNKQQLKKIYASLNPFVLKAAMTKKINVIYQLNKK